MTPNRGTSALADLVRRQTDLDHPVVRAALDHTASMWTAPGVSGRDVVRWGLFATAVQAVTATIYAGPPGLTVTDAPIANVDAAAEVALAAADLFDRCAPRSTTPATRGGPTRTTSPAPSPPATICTGNSTDCSPWSPASNPHRPPALTT
jgi:hypothetical protein